MIFILGAQGFVGSAFVRQLAARKICFTPITRANYVEHIEKRCTVLINASGNSRKYLTTRDPVREFDLSVDSVLRAICDFHPEHYVHLSSVDVYNNVSDSANNSEDTIIDPSGLSPYGFSKYLAELVTMRYAKRYLIIRLGGMVGPGLKKNPIYDLLHGRHLYVHPDSLYQYQLVTKVADIVLDLVQSDTKNEIFNLCGNGLISPRQVATWLGLSDVTHPAETLPERYEINIEKIKRCYPIPASADSVHTFIDSHCSETFNDLILKN